MIRKGGDRATGNPENAAVLSGLSELAGRTPFTHIGTELGQIHYALANRKELRGRNYLTSHKQIFPFASLRELSETIPQGQDFSQKVVTDGFEAVGSARQTAQGLEYAVSFAPARAFATHRKGTDKNPQQVRYVFHKGETEAQDTMDVLYTDPKRDVATGLLRVEKPEGPREVERVSRGQRSKAVSINEVTTYPVSLIEEGKVISSVAVDYDRYLRDLSYDSGRMPFPTNRRFSF